MRAYKYEELVRVVLIDGNKLLPIGGIVGA